MSLQEIGNIFQSDGSARGNSGEEAERLVRDKIRQIYKENTGYIYINERIPQFPVCPDFVIPAFSQDKKNLRIIIIECKADKFIRRDGSGNRSDAYEQLRKYRDVAQRCFHYYNKNIYVESYAIFPNAKNIFSDLGKDGINGIYWGDLNYLQSKLSNTIPIPPDHPLLNEINRIYDRRKILLDARTNRGDKKLGEHIKSFGGIHGIKGVAGTGKTYLLAQQIVKDAREEMRHLLYATHNKKLVEIFIKYVEAETKILHSEEVYPLGGPQKKVRYIQLENHSRIYFINIDAFPTRFITYGLDFEEGYSSYGPLYKICREFGIGGNDEENNNVSEQDYKNCRLKLINKLRERDFEISQNHRLFDGIYLDEFQDTKIDESRLKIITPFVAKDKRGEPNIFFAEDPLQSYLKWDDAKNLNNIQQEEDDDTASIVQNRYEIKTYTDLFGRKVIPTPLHRVYRTPKGIFKASFSLLKDGFKKGEYEKLFDENNSKCLKFDREGNKIERLSIKTLPSRLDEKRKKPTSKSASIAHVLDKKNVRADFHHLECRGCEWDNVFIFLHSDFLNNPNYLYTLMCRTKDYLALIEDGSNPNAVDDLFEKFKSSHKPT